MADRERKLPRLEDSYELLDESADVNALRTGPEQERIATPTRRLCLSWRIWHEDILVRVPSRRRSGSSGRASTSADRQGEEHGTASHSSVAVIEIERRR